MNYPMSGVIVSDVHLVRVLDAADDDDGCTRVCEGGGAELTGADHAADRGCGVQGELQVSLRA